jgi:hypothetical protein
VALLVASAAKEAGSAVKDKAADAMGVSPDHEPA